MRRRDAERQISFWKKALGIVDWDISYDSTPKAGVDHDIVHRKSIIYADRPAKGRPFAKTYFFHEVLHVAMRAMENAPNKKMAEEKLVAKLSSLVGGTHHG